MPHTLSPTPSYPPSHSITSLIPPTMPSMPSPPSNLSLTNHPLHSIPYYSTQISHSITSPLTLYSLSIIQLMPQISLASPPHILLTLIIPPPYPSLTNYTSPLTLISSMPSSISHPHSSSYLNYPLLTSSLIQLTSSYYHHHHLLHYHLYHHQYSFMLIQIIIRSLIYISLIILISYPHSLQENSVFSLQISYNLGIMMIPLSHHFIQ